MYIFLDNNKQITSYSNEWNFDVDFYIGIGKCKEIDDSVEFSIGDVYEDEKVYKPIYQVKLNNKNIVEEKIVSFELKEEYTEISKEQYDIIEDRKEYKYSNGEVKEYIYVDKNIKLKQLEEWIDNQKDIGVQYQDKWFKCDSEAENNLLQSIVMIDSLLPLTWFTRNGEEGFIIFNTKEEFMQFVGVISNKMKEIKEKNYAYKYAIENANSEEELDNIVFE